jgi:hypothetical protein
MKKYRTNKLIQLDLAFIKNSEKEKLVNLSKEEKMDLIQALAELMLSNARKNDLINIKE